MSPMMNSQNRNSSDQKLKPECEINRRCLYCGQVAQVVWVHGHGQCASCGINVDECCRGETG